MSPAKTVKKSISFSANEDDQRLLEYANEALDNDEYSSFNELAKAAFSSLFTGNSAAADAAPAEEDDSDDSDAEESDAEESDVEESDVEDTDAEDTDAEEGVTPLTADREEELFTSLQERLGSVQLAQGELQFLLQQQTDTLVAELQKIQADAESRNARDGERVVKLEETLVSMQSTQQDLLDALKGQGSTILEELKNLESAPPPSPAATPGDTAATEKPGTNGDSSTDSSPLSRLTSFLEDF